MRIYNLDSAKSRTVFDVAKEEKEIKSLESEMASPDFWNDQERARTVSSRANQKKEEVETIKGLEKELTDLEELYDLSKEEEKSLHEIEGKLQEFEKKLSKEEFRLYLSGTYDAGDAFLSVYSGAGGVDAQDWVSILLRMYQRWCEDHGYMMRILDQGLGEQGGIKHVACEVEGRYAYGHLKGGGADNYNYSLRSQVIIARRRSTT